MRQGGAIQDLYIHVFQCVQRELGRLWQINQITVAQEHYCSASTQLIMSQLYPYIFAGEKNGRKMVAACLGGELHEIGLRMVADIFEMGGWDTFYLGANTPPESIVQMLVVEQAELLALSATMNPPMASIKAFDKTKPRPVPAMLGCPLSSRSKGMKSRCI